MLAIYHYPCYNWERWAEGSPFWFAQNSNFGKKGD